MTTAARDVSTGEIRGQLLQRGTDTPLKGYIVKALEAGSDRAATMRNYAVTSDNGLFVLSYMTARSKGAGRPKGRTPRQLRLEVFDRDGRLVLQTVIRLKDGQDTLYTLHVPGVARSKEQSPALNDVLDSVGLALPRTVRATLAKHCIRTLDDVRVSGGLRHLKGLGAIASDPAVRALEAHASLSLLSSDLSVTSALIEKGYESPSAIAGTALPMFVAATHRALGDVGAARVYAKARALTAYVDNLAVEKRTHATSTIQADTAAPEGDGTSSGDGKDDGKDQPGDVSECVCKDCNAAGSPRAYLVDLLDYAVTHLKRQTSSGTLQPMDARDLASTFQVPVDELLDSCDAAEREIRQIRLCIELLRRFSGTPAESVNRRFLAQAEKAYGLTAYETLLSQMGTSSEELRYSQASEETAREALANRLGFALTANGQDRLERLHLERYDTTDEITEANLKELFGLVDTAPNAGPADALPLIVQWRKQYLRTLWGREDWQDDEAWSGPVIDPDLIGPDDFRSVAGEPFATWIIRRRQVDADLDALNALIPDLQGMLQHAYSGAAVPDLDALRANLDDGAVPADAIEAIAAKGFSIEGFRRLMEVRAKLAGPAYTPTDEEWFDVVSILAQARKLTRYVTTWLQEETTSNVILGTSSFWDSLSEPSVDHWPPDGHAARPLIDPDFTEVGDLRDVTVAGQPSQTLWQQRADALAPLASALQGFVAEDNVAKMVKEAINLPEPDTQIATELDALQTALTTTRANGTAPPAEIDSRFHLTTPQFDRVMTIKAKTADTNPAARPTEQDWNELIAILKDAFKRKSGWRAEEAGWSYWQLRKARLPPWRVDPGARSAWQTALNDFSARPIVDPDLLTVDDFAQPLDANAAYELTGQRRGAMQLEADALKAGREAAGVNLAGWFDAALAGIGISPAEWQLLRSQREMRRNIRPRLEQVGLAIDAFARLEQLYQLIDGGVTLRGSEWDEGDRILLAVKKSRRYAEWRRQERQHVTLGPDFFTLPGVSPELPTWLTTPQARSGWERTLRARISQDQAAEGSLDAAIEQAEETALPALREALIYVAYKKVHPGINTSADMPDHGQKERADWVARTFLIDAQTSACQKTTRTAQAIETMQGILWSVRIGLLQDAHPELVLQADAFDRDWSWMGSYAAWRGAMFAFLYPENILLPTLRRHRTPAFDSVVAALRMRGRITPDAAAAAAQSYSDYFHDVCDLTIEATDYSHDGFSGRTRVLLFARGGCTGKVYWSAYHPDQDADYAQSPWSLLPGLDKVDVSKILGVSLYAQGPQQTKSYVFMEGREGSARKICFLSYSQSVDQSPTWSEVQSLEIEQDGWSALLMHKQQVSAPPGFFIWGPAGFQCRELNNDGSGWDDPEKRSGDFASYKDLVNQTKPMGTLRPLSVLHDRRIMRFFMLAYDPEDSTLKALHIRDAIGGYFGFQQREWPIGYQGDWTWLGSFFHASDHRFVALWRSHVPDPNLNTSTFYVSMTLDLHLLAPVVGEYHVYQQPYAYVYWESDHMALMPSDGRDARYIAFRRAGQDTVHVLSTVYLTTHGQFAVNFHHDVIVAPSTRPNPIATSDLEGYDDYHNSKLRQDVQLNAGGPLSNLTYLDEAFYYVPIHLALQLRTAGYFVEALDWFRNVYDYRHDSFRRFVYPRLDPSAMAESADDVYRRAPDWLDDPLDVHAIAATRNPPLTDVRFVLLSLIQCVIEYADSEFAVDTAESIARARGLYMMALQLLAIDLLKGPARDCDAIIAELELAVSAPGAGSELWSTLIADIRTITDREALRTAAKDVRQVLLQTLPSDERLIRAQAIIRAAKERQAHKPTRTVAEALAAHSRRALDVRGSLLANRDIERAATAVQAAAERRVIGRLSQLSGRTAEQLAESHVALPWLRIADAAIVGRFAGQRGSRVITDALSAKDLLEGRWSVQPKYTFCVPPNPVLAWLGMHAELNLYKLRNCQNIGGLHRELPTYSVATGSTAALPVLGSNGQIVFRDDATIRPTQYRYKTLVERAKQLVSLSQLVEASFLAALEKTDVESYNLLKARQDSSVSHAQVRLQDLRIHEAEDGVTLARLQQDRAGIQEKHYADLIQTGVIDFEQWAALLLFASAGFQFGVAVLKTGAAFAAGTAAGAAAAGQGASYGGILGAAAYAAVDPTGGVLMAVSGGLSSLSSMLSMTASYARRAEEWEFQRALGKQDVLIGKQQTTIATDHVRVTGQERDIASLQAGHSDDVVQFLSGKFTSAELYDWMSGVLERAYRFFLQQAAATAKLAENQLHFERQQALPNFIQSDYSQTPATSVPAGSTQANSPDRRALTGSTRLLQDLYQLDQQAFNTDRRKLQITKTISLAQMAPVEFQAFRESGVLTFATPMALFDRDFPGHYLRLIKRVRVSVIALVPPTQGIHATLSASGISRVVIADSYEKVVIRRDPEVIALTAPVNATGVFELQEQPEMLYPFESMGVETAWEFRLPKAANFFEYQTIAEVLVTIDYTALDSPEYRQQVLQRLDRSISANRPYSFRHQLADQWYDLHHTPDEAAESRVVFITVREDFPPNLQDLRIDDVVLFFGRSNGEAFEVQVSRLLFTPEGSAGAIGGAAVSTDGVISTGGANAGSWAAMKGRAPFGTWELVLPNTEEMRSRFKNGQIEDVLFVITYSAQTPAWVP